MLRSLCCGAVVCCLVGLLIIGVLVCFGVLLLFVFLFVCVCSLFLALLFLCICSKSLPRGNQVDGLPRAVILMCFWRGLVCFSVLVRFDVYVGCIMVRSTLLDFGMVWPMMIF